MVYKHFFGRTPDGQAVTRFTLFNHNTMEVNLLNYGAAVHSICGAIPLLTIWQHRTSAGQ